MDMKELLNLGMYVDIGDITKTDIRFLFNLIKKGREEQILKYTK